MKLDRKTLICSQDKQLATIGVKRHKNAGWLQDCLARDFTAEEVEMFHKARKPTKADEHRARARLLPEPAKVAFASDPAIEAALALTESLSDKQRDWLMILVDESKKLGATNAQLAPIFAGMFCSLKIPTAAEMMIHERIAREIESGLTPARSPEDFANTLFEQSARDLSR